MNGRYLSPEPLLQVPQYALVMAQNGVSVPTYSYAGNNPLANIDADGRSILPRSGVPDGWSCEQLAAKINNVRKEISKRADELRENKMNLPKTCPGDKEQPSAQRQLLFPGSDNYTSPS